MYGVFNMGIGMALVVDEVNAETVVATLKDLGENAAIIGKVVDKEGVHFT